MSFPTRRIFLQSVGAASAALLPHSGLRVGKKSPSYWFVHTATQDSWPVDDPVLWSLKNARRPILERASQRLLTLTPDDRDRIIRLVVRRCRLNLIEIQGERVVVHFWGQQGMGDLRPFFKSHALPRKGVEVVGINRRHERMTIRSGEDFLFGERLAQDWPLDLYFTKWRRRRIEEPDDRTPAPHTRSGFAWKGIERDRIPWTALKNVWRRTTPSLCMNCDTPTILTNFGHLRCRVVSRDIRFLHVCGKCRRALQDSSMDCQARADDWLERNLQAEFWPDFIQEYRPHAGGEWVRLPMRS